MLVNKKTWALLAIQMISTNFFHKLSTATAKTAKACVTSDISDVDRGANKRVSSIQNKREDFVSDVDESEEQNDTNSESEPESTADEEHEESPPDKRQKKK